MKAVAVLTRGYPNIRQYHTLIQRNVHIAKNLSDKSIDILIFHEGNITEEHQKYIEAATPLLNIIFKCISDRAFRNEKSSITFHDTTKGFSLNYRHMCSFWFVEFWEYVLDYDLIIRIDEDCKIDFNVDNIFRLLEFKDVAFGKWDVDEDRVTVGLNDFTMNFLKDNNLFKKMKRRIPSGPYTNVIGLNLVKLRKNELLDAYKKRVETSNGIYKYRWGDLPLWGEVLIYMCHPDSYIYLTNLNYFHGSHNRDVGKTTNNMFQLK